MNVKSFKLMDGQELVAELISETGQGYLVNNPLAVHVLRGPDGGGHLAFAQWSMVQDASQPVEIFDHGLIAKPADLVDEVAKSYMEQVTGIALPTPPSSRILTG